jgi:hypothetical protein
VLKKLQIQFLIWAFIRKIKNLQKIIQEETKSIHVNIDKTKKNEAKNKKSKEDNKIKT